MRTVSVRGADVNLKTISIQDKSGTAEVTLWRDTYHSPVRPGDHITITDVVINVYKNETSLSITTRSKVMVCSYPIDK